MTLLLHLQDGVVCVTLPLISQLHNIIAAPCMLYLQQCMVALLSKYTILYGNVIQLVVTIQSVARRWTANSMLAITCSMQHV